MYLEINNPGEYHVALYIRLSKEDENEGPSQSVVNQQSLLNEFVERQQLSVFDTYVDDGFSGTSFDRPGFQRMLTDIEDKKVNMVITKDLSRLGRDYIMTGHYMERYFPEHRVRYISLLDGIDTGVDSSANEITPFRAIMNDMYARDISKKIRSVKRDKQRKGEFIGSKPVYGYKKHPTESNKIVVDEPAAAVVRRVFAMALSGMSCRKIAADLNMEGVQTPASYCGRKIGRTGPYTGLWSSERISEMLKNETYIGNMVQGRMVKISYKSRKCLRQPPEKWVIVEGTHAPIVDRETFRKVQILLSSRRYTRSRTYDFLLKGLIFCYECGYPMSVINRKNTAGEDRLFFICRTYQRFTKAGVCTCHSIKEQTVTEAVLAQVREMCEGYLNPEQLQDTAEKMIGDEERARNDAEEIQILQSQMDCLTRRMDQMYLEHLDGLIPEEDFRRIYGNLKTERTDRKEALKKLVKRKEKKENKEERAKKLVNQFLDSAYSGREFLCSIIERIELTERKEIIIKFRFRDPETYFQSTAEQEMMH